MNILSVFKNLPEDTTLAEAVMNNYDLCDYEFMETLKVFKVCGTS